MGKSALVVVDMLNPYDFEGADELASNVERVLPNITGLIERARDEETPVIYVNDNLGSWRSDWRELVEHLRKGNHTELVEPLLPPDDCLFIFKARHSIFFQTPLEYLLGQEEIERIVLTGQATEQCILYSALDAHIRHIECVVPRDAVAHIHEELADAALKMMELNMKATVCEAAEVEF